MNDKLKVVRMAHKYSKRHQYRRISGVIIYDLLYLMTLKVQKKAHHSIYHLWHSRANRILAIIQT